MSKVIVCLWPLFFLLAIDVFGLVGGHHLDISITQRHNMDQNMDMNHNGDRRMQQTIADTESFTNYDGKQERFGRIQVANGNSKTYNDENDRYDASADVERHQDENVGTNNLSEP